LTPDFVGVRERSLGQESLEESCLIPSLFLMVRNWKGVECQIREIYISFVTSGLGGKSGFGVLDKFFPYREEERKTRSFELTEED